MTPIISLHQPYADALFTPRADMPARMIKEHETRGRRYPAKYDGVVIGIHAAKKPFRLRLIDPAVASILIDYDLEPENLTYGAVIGTARLSGCWLADDRRPVSTVIDRIMGDWTPGRFVWRLTEAKRLPKPVPMIGQRGWWSADLEGAPQ